MDVSVEPVVRDDVIPLVDMELPKVQQAFVAPNAISLAQVHYEGGGHAFCIRADGERVGLVQVIDLRDCTFREDADDPQSVYLWRFMIVPGRQGEGIGRKVMNWLETWVRDRGLAKISLTVVPANTHAVRLYVACGYAPTGRIDDGEVEYEKLLTG